MRYTVLSGVVFGLIAVGVTATAMPPPLRKHNDQKNREGNETESRVTTARATVFSTLVRDNFKVWDLDKDGKLTSEEIHKAMARPGLKGEAAAAIAALRCVERYAYFRYDKEMPPFTLEDLKRYEAAGPRERREKFGARGEDFDAYFVEFKRKIRETRRDLFPDDVPRLAAVKQGYLGDCYFMSMVGAFVHLHPDRVCQMIKKVKGNKYSVTFAGAPRPFLVAAPTDAEIALNSSAEQNGLWLTVLEKAYGKREVLVHADGPRPPSLFDAIAEGGSGCYDAMAAFTGHAHVEAAADSPRFPEILQEATKNRLLICTKLRPRKDVPALYHPHVYAVIGYQANTQEVTLFDCIGDNFTPNGPPGPRNGFAMKDGIFTTTLADFKVVFTGIGYEDPKTPAVDERRRKGKD